MSYRDSPRELPPRDRDVLWRFRVARAADVLFWTFVVQVALVPVTFVPIVGPGLALVLAAIETWFTWQLTAPRPVSESPKRRRLRGWLRGLVVVMFLVKLSGRFIHAILSAPWFMPPFVLDIAFAVLGLLYVRELFREFNATASVEQSTLLVRRYCTRVAVIYGLVFALIGIVWVTRLAAMSSVDEVIVALLVIGIVGVWLSLLKVGIDVLKLLRRLTATLRIAWHEWWFKAGVGWASLAESEGSAEVIEPTGDRMVSPDMDAARRWLTQNDFVPEQQALAEAMVLNAPPPVAVSIGRGVWPVARKPTARVRVNAEGESDAVAVPVEDAEVAGSAEQTTRVTARRSTD